MASVFADAGTLLERRLPTGLDAWWFVVHQEEDEMATDDEPLDDLRAVGMTAGTAAARVFETIARDGQQRAQQQREAVETAQRQAATQAGLAAVPAQPQAQPYDSPARREAADQAMRAAKVPDEARKPGTCRT